VAETSEKAGEKAKLYWADMAEHDPSEFACLVGEETLIKWGMGQPAGPGSSKVRSMKEWLNLWVGTPEEQWASYDGKERTLYINKPLAEELGFDWNGDEEWMPVVGYRCN
jgi:hypothetical protein